ncbi:MAG: ATP-binding protein [Candidatus Saccharibacteria bacterium]|nr:ATP-binding protein [Candidatus Saccharibacteria bacterium]
MIKKIVLTGGPSGGKTTMLPILAKYFTNKGYDVAIVPEAATILLCNGIVLSEDNSVEVQIAISNIQMMLEDNFVAASSKSQKMIVLCDRGVGDNQAYCSKEDWDKVLSTINKTNSSINARYDGIIHLTTAAYGAVDHYRKENEAGFVRDPLTVARELDDKVFLAWKNHEKHFVVDNSTDFSGKIAKTISIIESLL